MTGAHLAAAGMGVGLRRSQSRLQLLWPVLPEMMVLKGCFVYHRVRKTDRVITAQLEKHTNNSCYYDVIVL